MALPHNKEYGERAYWEGRFANEDEFEWCKGYTHFSSLLKPHLSLAHKILIIGCGTSNLTKDLYDDGYSQITSIDYSTVVIEKMRRKHAALPQLEWMNMDMTDLKFEDSTFDAVIEKGTLDVLFVGERDPWNVGETTSARMRQCMASIFRVLKPAGVFLSITFAQPHFRMPFYSELEWGAHVSTFGDDFHFFVYVMKKGEGGCSRKGEGWIPEKDFDAVHHEMDTEEFLTKIDPGSP